MEFGTRKEGMGGMMEQGQTKTNVAKISHVVLVLKMREKRRERDYVLRKMTNCK